MSEISAVPTVNIIQSVAILIDGNNIERSLHSMTKDENCMINFDNLIPKLLRGRGLSRLIYFREGNQISSKLADRLLAHYMGSVVPCHKSADIPLSISATQIARKVDTIIILSGDSDYVELVRHLKGEGVRIEIAAVKATTAQILIDEADHFIEITEEDSFSLTPKRSNTKRSSSKSNTTRKSSTTSSNSNGSSTSNKKSSTATKAKINNATTKKTSKSSTKATASEKSNSNKKSSTKNNSKKSDSELKSKDNNKTAKKSTQKKTTQKSQTKSNTSKKTKSKSPKRATRNTRKRAAKVEPIDDFIY